MTLLELLVEELPGLGGWPNLGILAVQDVDKWICFSALPEVEINGGEWRTNGGGWVSCIKNCEHLAEDYSKAIITREQYEAALAASKPEWDGEGLPPVGCECMVRGEIGDDGWYECKVIAHTFFDGYNCAVFQTESTVSCSSEGNFRPIRSEADKKRDEIILQMSHSLRANGSVTEEQLCRLYSDIAAGYIPHIRID